MYERPLVAKSVDYGLPFRCSISTLAPASKRPQHRLWRSLREANEANHGRRSGEPLARFRGGQHCRARPPLPGCRRRGEGGLRRAARAAWRCRGRCGREIRLELARQKHRPSPSCARHQRHVAALPRRERELGRHAQPDDRGRQPRGAQAAAEELRGEGQAHLHRPALQHRQGLCLQRQLQGRSD